VTPELTHWLDRMTFALAPRWTMRRIRARVQLDLFQRHYEAATVGRRTQGWRRFTGDANAAVAQGGERLREHARDLVRNNPYAESAVATIADHTVSYGIVGKPEKGTPAREAARFLPAWQAWAETTACDADGRYDLAGLQKLVMRTVPEAGEVLVRRRWRRPEDNLPLPMQLQILEPDYLDHLKEASLPNGGVIVQGVEYDAIGRRVGYWLFSEHPGARSFGLRAGSRIESRRVPATEILHVFKGARPGQARGASWFAPVLLRLKDLDEYEDAALLKQKIAACLAVLTTDVDGTTPPIGATDATQPTWDVIEPGSIMNVAPGRAITVVDPPSVNEHPAYTQAVLQSIATGLGLTYEDLTGNYQALPFSAARMSRLRHWARIEDYRWRMLVPQFLDPVWSWAVEAAGVGLGVRGPIMAHWTAPPAAMIEPDKEGLAYARNIRAGLMTLSEAIRERGYDPEAMLAEYADDNARLDTLGIILDSDARMTTQQGGPRTSSTPGSDTPGEPTPIAATAPSGNGSNGTNYGAVPVVPVEVAFRILERALARPPAEAPAGAPPVAPVTNLNIEAGAFATTVAAPPAPTVNVDAPVTIAAGALQVEIAPPPPAEIHVAAPTVNVEPGVVNIAEGAVHVEVAAPPPAEVRVEAPITVEPAPVNIAEGAVRVDISAPISVEPQVTLSPVPEPKITIIRPRSAPASDTTDPPDPVA